MMIYLAGPLFCQAERAFNLDLTQKLEQHGFSVFLPQRDGIELSEDLFKELSEKELCKKIFDIDRDMLLKADIFLMILDGRVPDEGACVELGIAHESKYADGKEKLLIGYSTDMRVYAENFHLNAMLLGALDEWTDNEAELIDKIKTFQIVQ
jgi:nucleoside 2-deoxyribosyltransferase